MARCGYSDEGNVALAVRRRRGMCSSEDMREGGREGEEAVICITKFRIDIYSVYSVLFSFFSLCWRPNGAYPSNE